MAWPVERCLYDGPCGCQEINSPPPALGRSAGSIPDWRLSPRALICAVLLPNANHCLFIKKDDFKQDAFSFAAKTVQISRIGSASATAGFMCLLSGVCLIICECISSVAIMMEICKQNTGHNLNDYK